MKRRLIFLLCIGQICYASQKKSMDVQDWIWLCYAKNMYCKSCIIDNRYVLTSLDRYPGYYIIRQVTFDRYTDFSTDNNNFIVKNMPQDCRILYGLDKKYINLFKASHLSIQDHVHLKHTISSLYEKAVVLTTFKQAYMNIVAMHEQLSVAPLSSMIIKPKQKSRRCC